MSVQSFEASGSQATFDFIDAINAAYTPPESVNEVSIEGKDDIRAILELKSEEYADRLLAADAGKEIDETTAMRMLILDALLAHGKIEKDSLQTLVAGTLAYAGVEFDEWSFDRSYGIVVRNAWGFGNRLPKSKEQADELKLIDTKVVPAFAKLRKLADDTSAVVNPAEITLSYGAGLQVTLLPQHAHQSSDRGGIVAKVVATKDGAPIGKKKHIAFWHDWYSADHDVRSGHGFADLGDAPLAELELKGYDEAEKPKTYISMRTEDYPDMTWIGLPEASDPDAARKSQVYRGTFALFQALVDANPES